jgi:putative transposase
MHLVFVTKYRRQGSPTKCSSSASTPCERCGPTSISKLVEFNGEADHLHLLAAYLPSLAISTLIQRLKGRTAHAVRREYTAACVGARMRGHLGSPTYFATSCGGALLSIIKQYIDGQSRPLQDRGGRPPTNGIG